MKNFKTGKAKIEVLYEFTDFLNGWRLIRRNLDEKYYYRIQWKQGYRWTAWPGKGKMYVYGNAVYEWQDLVRRLKA